MKKSIWWLIPVVVLIGIAAALYLARQGADVEPEEQPPAPMAESEPAILHPIPEPGPLPEEARPLPPLDDSDQAMLDSLLGLVGPEAIQGFLVPDEIIRHVVVTVDNLPGKKLALKRRPVPPIGGEFQVVREGDEIFLSPDNYSRYAAFVRLVELADISRVAATYFRFYPLFQQAYEELGYPDRYFNDRLVEVIDHLLATPEVPEPVRLTQPSVYFQFADPQLESLSAGQKALIRMGPQHAVVIKARLLELRREVAGRIPA